MGYQDQAASTSIEVAISPELKHELELRANKARRPLSGWLRLLLIDLVEKGESELIETR